MELSRQEQMIGFGQETFMDDSPAPTRRLARPQAQQTSSLQQLFPKQQPAPARRAAAPPIIVVSEPSIEQVAAQKVADAAEIARIIQSSETLPAREATPTKTPTSIQNAFLSSNIHPTVQSVFFFLTIVLILGALNWGVMMSLGSRRDVVSYITATATSKTRQRVERLVYGAWTAVAVAYIILLVLLSRGEFDMKPARKLITHG